MIYNKFSRRMFLQGAAGQLVAIPFLTSLLPRKLWAQSTPVPLRYIALLSSYDIGHHSMWLPGANASNKFNIPQPLNVLSPGGGHHDIHWQALRDFAPGNSDILSVLAGSKLSPYLNSINLMRSLDFIVRYGHDNTHILGGLNPGSTGEPNQDIGSLKLIPTIDQVLNNSRKFNLAGRPHIFCGSTGAAGWSYSLTGTTVAQASSVGYDFQSIYNSLFSSGTFPETGQVSVAHPKNNILSRVLEDYTRVKNSRYISAADKISLQNAFDKLSDVQNGLTQVTTAACHYKSLTQTGGMWGAHSDPIVGKQLVDLVTAAVMCDSARTFVLGVDFPNYGYPVEGIDFDHQVTSHTPFTMTQGKPEYQRMAERQAKTIENVVAPLIQALSTATDPSNGKSYLYNSIVHYSIENGQVHGNQTHPTILAGNAGGSLSSGNYIDYANRVLGPAVGADSGATLFNATPSDPQFSNNWFGVSYNRLLVTILQAMGLSPADYEDDTVNSQMYGQTASVVGAPNANLSSIGGYGYAFRGDMNSGSWAPSTYKVNIQNYDLKQFRNKLPMPPSAV